MNAATVSPRRKAPARPAKKRVTRNVNVSPLQVGQPVPLNQVSITWQRDSYFVGEERPQDVKISGVELAAVLTWMTTSTPGRPTNFGRGEYWARNLRGL